MAASSTVIRALDRVVDVVAIVVLYLLALNGKIDGTLAGGIIGAIAGVGEFLRTRSPVNVGVSGTLLLLALSHSPRIAAVLSSMVAAVLLTSLAVLL